MTQNQIALADIIGRNVVEPDGIPAGIIVALIGAPYFMYLLLKNKRSRDCLT
ncbi:iron ABC transporter permease [Peribacillus asahii]|uniref:Iron ABC transporter permease n=1 Tax=Peribacillus asahii TaxID=228899 RepID=A0A3T0KZ71_9BACI|nr:iron ABC transporter permease [Peribacillus asahii]